MENAGASRALAAGSRRRAFLETFLVFLRLGLVSFGGPIAHIGYFRNEFVQRRHWLDEHAFSDLVALCQLLPGPASSQLGMAIGFGRAGWSGIAGAWLGFTLPSALALILFALGVAHLDMVAGSGAVQGLKVVAVAVVAQAVWGMGRTLCPDRTRIGLALGAFLLVLGLPRLLPGAVAVPALVQVAAIVTGGLLGRGLLALDRAAPGVVDLRVPARAGRLALVAFALLLAGLPLLAAVGDSMLLRLIDGFYRAGALVFGGGHVVLPLLEAAVVPIGAVGEAQFLAGYGAAQAVPGPLFSFGAYLGALAALPLAAPQGVDAVAALPAHTSWFAGHGWTTWGPWVTGLFFLVVIFLPGFLVLIAALPAWTRLRHRPALRSTVAGVNAAVVGILLAALYDPLWTGAIRSWGDALLALAAFLLLVRARLPPVLVVGLAALAGWAMGA
jgi:chromate transporter